MLLRLRRLFSALPAGETAGHPSGKHGAVGARNARRFAFHLSLDGDSERHDLPFVCAKGQPESLAQRNPGCALFDICAAYNAGRLGVLFVPGERRHPTNRPHRLVCVVVAQTGVSVSVVTAFFVRATGRTARRNSPVFSYNIAPYDPALYH